LRNFLLSQRSRTPILNPVHNIVVTGKRPPKPMTVLCITLMPFIILISRK
jgi:hypothetical protein